MSWEILSAGLFRFHGNSIADFDICHFGADFSHNSSALVAQNHGFLDNEIANSSFHPVVYIRPTNPVVSTTNGILPGRFDFDFDFIRGLNLGDGTFLERHRFYSLQHERWILFSLGHEYFALEMAGYRCL